MAAKRIRKTRVYQVGLPDGRNDQRIFRSGAEAKAWVSKKSGRSLGEWKPREQTVWRALVPRPDGRYREKNFSSMGEADQHKADEQAARSVGLDREAAKETLGELIKRWLPGVSFEWEEATRQQAESFLRTHILPEFGEWAVGSIRYSDVQGWVGRMRRQGLASSTVRRVVRLLGRALDSGVRDGALNRNPCHGTKFGKSGKSGRSKRWLTKEEVLALADAVAPRYRALVLTGCLAGLRFEELAGLRRDRILEPVDLVAHHRIRVDRALVEVGGRLIEKDPKTDASWRTVPIPKVLASALEAHCEEFGVEPGGLVFLSPTGQKLRRGNFSRRVLGPVSEQALGERIGTHDLRRSFGAFKLAEGVNPKVIQKWMGHSSIRVTMDIYTEVLDELEVGSMELVEAANSGADFAPGLAENGPEESRENRKAL